MKIMIVGAGGVGGALAGKLAQQYTDITVIARGEHLRAIQEQGLTLVEESGQKTMRLTATDTPKGVQDAIFLCTKGYGLKDALRSIRPCVGAHTMIIPLLNGVNIYRTIEEMLPEGQALSGSIYVYANIVSPGVVEIHGKMLRVLMGVPHKPSLEAPEALHTLQAMMQKSGIATEIVDDILLENWVKWAVLVSNGQSNAYFDAPVGVVRENPKMMEFVMQMLQEVMAVAKAEGITLPDTLPETVRATMHNLPYESRSSLTRDIQTPNKPTELALFSGELCRMAEKHGIPVPANSSMLERFRERL